MKNKNQWIKWVVGVLFIAIVSGAVYFGKSSTQKGVFSGLPSNSQLIETAPRPAAPDLKVISINVVPGGKLNTTIVRAKIKNSGSLVAKENFDVALALAQTPGTGPGNPNANAVSSAPISPFTASARVSIDGLATGDVREVSHTFNRTFELIGYVLVTADFDNRVLEFNEDNNQAAKELPPLPNVPAGYTVLPSGLPSGPF